MFKYEDTTIEGELNLESGTYILAHSDDCEEAYFTGYTVRHYEGQGEDDVQPWADEPDSTIDFADLAGGLAELDAFPDEDRDALTEWLTAEVCRTPLTEVERAKVFVLRQQAARDMFDALTAEGKECRLVNDDQAVEVQSSPGHFMTYDVQICLHR